MFIDRCIFEVVMISYDEILQAYYGWYIENVFDKSTDRAKVDKEYYLALKDSFTLPVNTAIVLCTKEIGERGGDLISHIDYLERVDYYDTRALKTANFYFRIYNKAVFDETGDIVDFEPVGYEYKTDDKIFEPDFNFGDDSAGA